MGPQEKYRHAMRAWTTKPGKILRVRSAVRSPGIWRLRGRGDGPLTAVTLWARPVIAAALVWVLTALGVVTLPQVFRKADYVSGAVLALAALWYLAALRGRLARGEAGPDLITDKHPGA
jgi:hypothetical protein